MTLFQNKYRIESARLQSWDYSTPAYYFVTTCIYNRRCLFGEINDGVMTLNNFGQIAYDEWERTFEIRRNLLRDDFVVMPNHFHAIVHIVGPVSVETPWHGVSTDTDTGTDNAHWKPGVLGVIIGQFKQQVTKKIRHNGLPKFQWQYRFHDHIVRNEQELIRIRRYIRNNPAQWDKDKFYFSSKPDVKKQFYQVTRIRWRNLTLPII